jgi:hypothetical protein
MGNNKQWPVDITERMVELYLEGKPNIVIADEIGKSVASVKAMMSKVRKERGLPHRDVKQIVANRGIQKQRPSEFDKAWQGHVPFGHWSITKPWRKRA